LVTAALLGAMFLLVAGSFGWMARDRAAQRGRTAEAVAVLLDQCEAGLRDDRADRAAIALETAERRAAEGGAEALAGRLACRRIDLALLRELDAIDTFRWTWADRSFPDPKVVAARWQAALAEYGVTPDEGRAAELAERVNDSLVRDRLMTALDGWHNIEPSAGLRAVLRSADPDPYRNAVRDAVAARVARPVVVLVESPDALQQPPWFAAFLGQLEQPPADRRRAVLESAHRARPGDLNLLMALGASYPGAIRQPERAVERVRWFQAAVAAHPENLAARLNLGLALLAMGDSHGAAANFQGAVLLDPKNAHAYNGLAWLLAVGPDGLRDGRRAVEHATRACELRSWNYPEAIDTLAAAYAEIGDFDKAVEFEKQALSFPGFEKEQGKGGRERLQLYAQKKTYRDPAFGPHEVAPSREVKP
jgi:tetratricopeptide (TPR) repeat protein